MCLNGDIGSCDGINDANAIGYRLRLYNLLTSAGYNFDFVGNNKYGYAFLTDSDNAGFSGITSSALADVVETGSTSWRGLSVTPGPYLESYPADIVLLHIGTNDVLATNYGVSNVSRILDAIDDYENSSGNPVLVIISKIISQANYPCNSHPGTNAFNNNLNSMVQNRIGSGDKIIYINMECNAGINYYTDLIDQVHPNQTGYDKMADLWFQTIDNLNSAPVVSQIPDQERDRGSAFSQINLDSYVTDNEDPDQNITWTTIPSSPQYFNVSINENRVATISPKSSTWSGSEIIEFVAWDNGNIIPQLKKFDNVPVEFRVNWTPEITGQKALSTNEDVAKTIKITDLTIVEPEKAPVGMTLIVEDGENYSVSGATVTPDLNFNGNLSIPVRINADGKISNSYNFIISVNPVNDPPVINSQIQDLSTKQGDCVNVELSMLSVSDPDNTYPAGFSVQILPGNYYSFSGKSVCPNSVYTGVLPVNLRVYDGQAYSSSFVFNLTVLGNKPVFILPEDLDVLQDENYNAEVDINHYNPDAFSISATELPEWMSFNPSTKKLNGTPANDNIGDNSVSLRVTDGEVTVDTSFVVQVINVNDPPVITSQPPLSAQTGKSYNYLLVASDIDPGDQLFYSFTEKPAWAGFDPNTGLLSGTPSKDDVGSFNVNLRVSDGEYEVDQEFQVEVEFFNQPPIITTVPKDTAFVGQTYTYGLRAEDPENEVVSYFVKSLPEWLVFYSTTRVLIGTPASDDAGSELVILGATDGLDTTYQVYTLKVIFTSSFQNPELKNKVRVFPNPASGYVNVSIEDANISETIYFEILDLNGRQILLETFRNQDIKTIELKTDIPDGIYLYRVLQGDRRESIQSGKLLIR
jgi:lysophospholipase L1-like esterase